LPQAHIAALYRADARVSTPRQVTTTVHHLPASVPMEPQAPAKFKEPLERRAIILVGMMGAGKTAVGRRLARELGWRFVDADQEIEKAAGTSIANIFAEVGEAEFRHSERQIIARLLQDRRPQVLALGGGAFIDPETRALVRECGISVWLRADLDVLVKRTARRDDRPLLKGGDPRARLAALLERREPIYAEADLAVDSSDGPLRGIVARILEQLPQDGEEQG
jgi:shikimate kinase